jgi:NAD(P)-dependent dehydrogenase (short-subunit alcohol dehydrogenase family)
MNANLRSEEVGVLIEGKSAVIYGGAGSIGGAVARAFAREGARVFLAGRRHAALERRSPSTRSRRCDASSPPSWGPHGIRVGTLASGGIPESLPEGFDGRAEIVELIEGQTLLGRAATLEDVGNAAVFAASDWARSMTAAIVNVSCGALVD